MVKSRVVRAGSEADEEPNSEQNLYLVLMVRDDSKQVAPAAESVKPLYRCIANHTKKQYVDKHLCGWRWRSLSALVGGHAMNEFDESENIHPLPQLTAEGNGRGGGNYYGSCQLIFNF